MFVTSLLTLLVVPIVAISVDIFMVVETAIVGLIRIWESRRASKRRGEPVATPQK